MRVVIPSKGRADTINKHSLFLFPDAIVCVDQAEADDYLEVVPEGNLLLHPELRPLAAIRNWIFDNVDVDVLVVADDDVTTLKAMPGWSPRAKRDPDVAWAVLENAAQCAIDAGAAMFGFNQNPNPLHYRPQQPITLNGWVGSVIGFVRGHDLRYDERLAMHDDVDVCLSSLMRHRIIWRDERWAFINQRLTNAGGLADYRSAEKELEEQRILKEKWGRYVSFRTMSSDPRRKKKGLAQATTLMTTVRVPRKSHLAVA